MYAVPLPPRLTDLNARPAIVPPISGASDDDATRVATTITDASLCVECIAKRCGMPSARVEVALTAHAASVPLTTATRRCDVCLATRWTFRRRAAAAQGDGRGVRGRRRTQEAIHRFLTEHRGQAFCAYCIAQDLFPGRDIDVAMRHLEGNGVHRCHSQCDDCGKARLVASVPSRP